MAVRNQGAFSRKMWDTLLISNDSANGISSFESDKQRLETNEACDSGYLKGVLTIELPTFNFFMLKLLPAAFVKQRHAL